MNWNDACLHHIWDSKLYGPKHDMACRACGVTVPYRAVASFLPPEEMQKAPSADDLRKAALKCLELTGLKQLVIKKAVGMISPLSAPLVINENNVRISGQMLEDAGVVGAKAFSAKGLNDECNHSSVEWRLREDGWGAVLCRRCGVNLSKYFGKKERSSTAVTEDLQVCSARDGLTPDNRRPRVSLRTDAQIAHERAALRLRQHKLARWGLADSVDWDEQS